MTINHRHVVSIIAAFAISGAAGVLCAAGCHKRDESRKGGGHDASETTKTSPATSTAQDISQSQPAEFTTESVKTGDELPPVPADALDDYLNACDVIEMLLKKPDKAGGSGEWDTAIDRLAKAQQIAPTSPRILQNLGLASELRGRNLAAIAWLNAASCAIHKINSDSPQLEEIRKRIVALHRKADNEVELLLAFAKSEIPHIHTKKFPAGVEDVNVPSLDQVRVAVGLPMAIQLPDGQWVRNPQLDNPPAPPDVSQADLEKYLLLVRIGVGDATAIDDVQEHLKTYQSDYPNAIASRTRLETYAACIGSLIKAEAWMQATNLSEDAARWCEKNGTESETAHFWKLRTETRAKLAEDKPDELTQWVTIAQEFSKSNDEVWLDAKVEKLRLSSVKDSSIIEGIAKAIKPIAISHLRLRAVTQSKYVMGLDGR